MLDENFNTFQQYFYDNILKLPPHINIPLKHHEVSDLLITGVIIKVQAFMYTCNKGLDLECTEEQEDLIDQELEKARRAVLAVCHPRLILSICIDAYINPVYIAKSFPTPVGKENEATAGRQR